MEVEFYFASPEGDVRLSSDILRRPFVVRPLENHPFLTLGDFFEVIKDFLLTDGEGWEVGHAERARRLVIRYEKYGTLYHIASVEWEGDRAGNKFAVLAALAPESQAALDRESHLLNQLNERFSYSFIPRIYEKKRIRIGPLGKKETFTMALTNWFVGFHEWHFSVDKDPAETITIWDMDRGLQTSAQETILKIVHEATRILTLYYDPVSTHRIIAWHHGAGDFVVKVLGENVDVRLISVRGYAPITIISETKRANPWRGFLAFFLESTVKMRLDKRGGMGDPIWAGAFVLPAIVTGFFQGIQSKERMGEIPQGQSDKIIHFLKSMSRDEIEKDLGRHIEAFRTSDPVDFVCMRAHIHDHAVELFQTLQAFPL